jgi:cytochrome P450
MDTIHPTTISRRSADPREQDLDLDGLFAALFSDDGAQDPYPFLRRYHGPGVTHGLALRVLRDRRFRNRTMPASEHAMWSSFGRWPISLKGVEHSRMRALAATPFARHLVDGYVPTIDRVTRTLLDSMEASSQPVELMSAYAYRVPIQVIAALMGVPEEDRPKLDAPLMRLGTALERQRDPAWVAAGDGAIDALNAYFEPLLHDRRRRPSDDLLSALAAGTDVAFDTVLANAIFLMVAGHQTTMATIGSCVLMLLQRGDQMALIRERPDLASSAIEESLRFQSPVQITERTALATLDVDGFRFEPGDYVPIFNGAVNRDPGVFPDPDRFEIARDPNPHLAFTAGPHFCLGAPLARLEASMALAAS